MTHFAEALPFPVWAFDAEYRLSFANSACWAHAGVAPNLFPPGTPLAELIRNFAYRGLLGPGDPEALASQHLAQDRTRPLRRVLRQANNQCHELLSNPLPEGGFVALLHDVTALVTTGEQAQALASRLEDVLARLHGGLALYDPQSHLQLHNAAYERLLGLPRGTLPPGIAYTDVLRLLAQRGEFANTDPDALLAARSMVDRSKPQRVERTRPTGQTLQLASQPVAEGGWLVEVTDITPVKQAEEEARRRAAQLDAVLASLPLGIMVVGPDLRVALFNAPCQAIFGEVELRLGEHREDLARRRATAGAYGEGDIEALTQANLTPINTPMSVRQRITPSGQVLEIRAAPMPGGGYVQVMADITALHRAQAEASQRASMMQVMLDHMRHGIALFDRDRRLITSNALTARLVGLTTEQLRPGTHLDELRAAQVAADEFGPPEQAAAHLAVSTRHNTNTPFRFTRRRPDGTILDITSDPTPDGGFVRTYVDITARARAEAEAEHRAATLQAMIDNLRVGILLFGPDRRLLAANPLAAGLSGLPESALVPGAALADLLDQQTAANAAGETALCEQLTKQALALDRSQPQRHIRPTGDGRLLEVSSSPMPDGGFIISHNDITPLARAEAEARQQATALRTALDNMRHGIAMFDREGKLIVANALAMELSGAPAELVQPGTTFIQLCRAQAAAGEFGDAATKRALFERIGGPDRSQPMRYTRTRPNGMVLDVASAPTPDGGFVITYSDITARAQAEAQAAERAEALQAALDNMRHGIAMYGPDQRLRVANKLAAPVMGLPQLDERVGTPFATLVAEQLVVGNFGAEPLASARAAEVMALDRSKNHQYQRELPDGTVIEVTSAPTTDGGFVVTHADITARAKAEAAAAERTALLQAMQQHIRHGIALYGPDRRLITSNALFAALCGLLPEDLYPGRAYDSLAQAQFDNGVFGQGEAAAAALHEMLTLDRSKPFRRLRYWQDGRVMEIHSAPTAEGGFAISVAEITELEQARAAAASRAALLQATLDNVQHGIAVYDAGGRLLTSNSLAADMCGIPQAEMRPGRLHAELRQLQASRGAYGTGSGAEARLRQGNERDWHKPARYQRTDNLGRVIDISVNPMPDGGYVLGWSDITALVQAQAEAARRADMLQVMMDNMRHGISLYDADQRLVAANHLVPRLNGLSVGDTLRIGRTLTELLDEQLALGRITAAQRRRQLTLDRGKPDRIIAAFPNEVVLEIRSDPTPDGGFIITHSDITELNQARAEAQRRADVLQVMQDSMRHGIALFDAAQHLLSFNRLAAEFSGIPYDPAQAGNSFANFLKAQHAAGLMTAEEMTLSLGWDRRKPLRTQRTDQHGRILQLASDPTPDGGFVITLSDITPLARAEAEARSRAELLQVMLDNMRHGIARYDADRRLITANQLALRINGLADVPLASLVGQREDDIAQMMFQRGAISEAAWRGSAAADVTSYRRHTFTNPEGIVVSFTASPTPDGGYVVTFSDVTELVQAEAEAKSRAQVLQVMLDNMRHGICYYGADRRVIAANRLVAQLGGHGTEAAMLGRSLDELIDEQLATGAVPPAARVIAQQARAQDRSQPARHVRPTGDGRVLEVTSDPTPDGGFVVTSTDITRLVETEAVAQSRAATLEVMLNNIRHGIVLFNAEHRIVAVNPVVLGLLELPAEKLAPGMDVTAFAQCLAAQGEFGAGADAEAGAHAIRTRNRRQTNRIVRTRPNGRVLEVVSDPTPDGGFVLTYTDVTQDRRVRAELEAAREAAEAANQAKSRFLATMTHELRTPLNAVIGFSEALQTAPSATHAAEYLGSIHEAGRHLLGLVDDILDVTRAETTGFQVAENEVDLHPLCESTVRVMRAAAASGQVALGLDLPDDLPSLRADEMRLRQVLLNLLSNAVKFTPAGGHVTLSARQEADASLVLRVQDTGIGVSAEDMPRAFGLFTQLDSSLARRFPGSGLGLYLSRALAEAQGATLTLESAPGQGTTAVLRFPPERLVPNGPVPPTYAP